MAPTHEWRTQRLRPNLCGCEYEIRLDARAADRDASVVVLAWTRRCPRHRRQDGFLIHRICADESRLFNEAYAAVAAHVSAEALAAVSRIDEAGVLRIARLASLPTAARAAAQRAVDVACGAGKVAFA